MIEAARTGSMQLWSQYYTTIDSPEPELAYFDFFQELGKFLNENESEPDVSTWDESYRLRFFQVYEHCRNSVIKQSRICM